MFEIPENKREVILSEARNGSPMSKILKRVRGVSRSEVTKFLKSKNLYGTWNYIKYSNPKIYLEIVRLSHVKTQYQIVKQFKGITTEHQIRKVYKELDITPLGLVSSEDCSPSSPEDKKESIKSSENSLQRIQRLRKSLETPQTKKGNQSKTKTPEKISSAPLVLKEPEKSQNKEEVVVYKEINKEALLEETIKNLTENKAFLRSIKDKVGLNRKPFGKKGRDFQKRISDLGFQNKLFSLNIEYGCGVSYVFLDALLSIIERKE